MTSKLTITDDKLSALLSEMERSFTGCQGHGYIDAAEEYGDMISALRELQERRKTEKDSEPVVWINGCNKSVPASLRYLAENPRPIGGESSFNTVHLYQLAREIELMAEAPLYRYAQPAPVVPEEKPMPNPLSMYVVDAVAAIAEAKGWNACRAAMLQHQPQNAQQNIPENIPGGLVEAVNNLLNNDGSRGCYDAMECGTAREKIELWLAQRQRWEEQRKANLSAGNSPVIPDGYVMVPKDVSPEQLRAFQLKTKIGAYVTANWSGAYDSLRELWDVAIAHCPKIKTMD